MIGELNLVGDVKDPEIAIAITEMECYCGVDACSPAP